MGMTHISLNFPAGSGPAIELVPAPLPGRPDANPNAGLRIFGIFLAADKKANVYFYSSVTNKPLMGNNAARISLDESTNFVLPPAWTPWFEVPAGEALYIETDNDVALAGAIVYDDTKRVDL